MAPKGKTQAERLIVLETIIESFTKSQEDFQDEMRKRFESIEAKIDMRNKVDEIHTVLTQGNQPKTALQKFGNTARDVKDIVMTFIMALAVLAILLKVDFTALIK